MPATKNLDDKYIEYQASQIIVYIPHINFHETLKYRDNGGFRKTKEKAISIRNKEFKDSTGMEISKETRHFKSRTNNPDLIPGITIEYRKGKMTYITVSHSTEKMGNPSKTRFSIKKIGYKEAIKLAKQDLKNKKQKNK